MLGTPTTSVLSYPVLLHYTSAQACKVGEQLAMIVLDAISTETAEIARKSLVEQAEGGRTAEAEQTSTQKRNDKPYTILKDTPEVVHACDEFAKVHYKHGLITTSTN